MPRYALSPLTYLTLIMFDSNPNVFYIVIDYHLDWCGPCDAIEPNYRAMFFAIEEADKRIEFLTVCTHNLFVIRFRAFHFSLKDIVCPITDIFYFLSRLPNLFCLKKSKAPWRWHVNQSLLSGRLERKRLLLTEFLLMKSRPKLMNYCQHWMIDWW